MYLYVGNTSDTSYYAGWSVGYKYVHKEYGSNSSSSGWATTILDTPSKIGNVVGASDYYNVSYSASAVTNYTTSLESISSGSTIVRSTLSIGSRGSANEAYLDVDWKPEFFKPSVSTLTPQNIYLNSNNVNKFTWVYSCPDGSIQKSYTIEWKNGIGGAVNTISAESALSECNVPANTFPTGSQIYWRVKAISATDTEGDFSDWVTFNVHLTPTITSLEPSNIPQNRESQITVSWEGQNIDQFTLNVKQNGVTIRTYTGTTQKQILIQANTLSVGTCTLELICKWTTSGLTTTKTVSFEVYGKPNPPTLDQSTLYSTSLPNFTWNYNGIEQTSYNLEIRTLANVLVEQITQIGANKSYKTINNLANNTTYIVKVRIKNSWDLWSDYATKQFTIQYTELSKPNILIYGEGNNAVIEMTAPDVSIFSHNSIYRKTDRTDWIRIANNLLSIDSVTDYTIGEGTKYYYKVRSVGTSGELADSDIVSITTNVNDYILTDTTNPTNQIIINSNPQSKFNKVRKTSYNVFAGCTKPTIEVGIESYTEAKLSFFIERNEYDSCMDMLTRNTILSYRDYMGRQMFGFIVGDIKDNYEDYLEAYNIEVNLIEVDFDIQDMLFSNGLKPSINVIYLDGKYKLDGSIKLTGVVQG
ncbi:hypothetical protein [Cellulosilyticum sp. I15G10I2]|uniref:hypothetical protein n=1 Tax=Cellulosilyticum sp. I15G10I2 TaxID=1892843 RepID=UPI00114CD9CB|nr:hypothetical protein [Cellulosilyticum sp. I15G10I2]